MSLVSYHVSSAQSSLYNNYNFDSGGAWVLEPDLEFVRSHHYAKKCKSSTRARRIPCEGRHIRSWIADLALPHIWLFELEVLSFFSALIKMIVIMPGSYVC